MRILTPMVLLLCAGCISDGRPSTYSLTQPGAIVDLRAGNEKIFVARDAAAHDRIVTLSRARDTYGLMEMALQGRLFVVESGTRAKIIDHGVFTTEVRIESGDQKGKSGLVSTDFLVP